jgi:16S rRNA (uracil1498-N3)-methyltransferase
VTPPLFLLDPLPAGSVVLLGGDEGRHAARVRRLAVGEPVWIGDGAGTVLDCVVDSVHREGLSLRVCARRSVPAPAPRLVVVQAPPKGERGELAVELLTELGADEIVPWAASRCVVRWDDARAERAVERWRRTAREAAKQSRRAWLPAIAAVHSTAEVAGRLAEAVGLVLHEDASAGLASVDLADAESVVLVVGPEGGIAPDELAAFEAAGAVAVRLGTSVLRTSTAGAAALGALSVQLGRWR